MSRIQNSPVGINPKLIFKIVLHPKGNLDVDDLRRLGLQVLGIDTRRALVVFPDEETLSELRRRISEYGGLVADGHAYAYLASIDAIEELSPSDRTGYLLATQPLGEDEIAALDIELWHSGDRQECVRNIEEIQTFLEQSGLAVTDSYVGSSLCVTRAKLNRTVLDQLLGGSPFDYVKEIDRRPQPSFDLGDVRRLELGELYTLGPDEVVAADLIGIVVVDSGVMQLHPLLGPALGDAQVFPDRLRQRVRGGAEDGDELTGGHGTAVAGVAIYGDVGESIQLRRFVPTAILFSARVTDDKNDFDDDELLEHQLDAAVRYFISNYPVVRVINVSLGAKNRVYSDEKHQFRFAAALDELAYEFRDRDLVFVVSSGNSEPDCDSHDDAIQMYPSYLLNSMSARVIDPATAAIAITVGGLSYGTGRDARTNIDDRTDRLVAGHRGWPSPFTRTGWGFADSVKPEVVEYAGDSRFEKGRIWQVPTYAGLPTTSRNFAPPQGSLFRTVAGTSFAAPRVANLAARLMKEFPDATSNLIRALIVDSARIPNSRPPSLACLPPESDEILRLYGYGQPDFERARWSGQGRALLLAEGVIPIDSFEIFTIPGLPLDFLTSPGTGYISVSLAFDPPTRHTRADNYLGVTMGFHLRRNVTPERMADAIREWDKKELKRNAWQRKDLPTLSQLRSDSGLSVKCESLQPGIQRRSKGTLQRAVMPITNRNWQYDGDALTLAVICSREWAPAEVVDQRYALVVSVYHDNPDVAVYNHIRGKTGLFQRVRARVVP